MNRLLISASILTAKARRRLYAPRPAAARRPPLTPERIGIVSTFNEVCGIAEFTGHLLKAGGEAATVFAPDDAPPLSRDPAWVRRCWRRNDGPSLDRLARTVIASGVEIVVIQFNFGLFEFDSLARLIKALTVSGRRVFVHFHATRDPPDQPRKRLVRLAPALRDCAGLIVHATDDIARLASLGLEARATLIPHGMPDSPPLDEPPRSARFRVASYGFFFPQKGLDVLIEAIALLQLRGTDVGLTMLNAEHPSPVSRACVAAARDQIARLGLGDLVELDTRFMPDSETRSRFGAVHGLVFPYRPATDSASGAARHAIASGRMVLVTPIPMFEEFGEAVFRFAGLDAQDLADGLEHFRNHVVSASAEPAFACIRSAAAAWRADHRFPVVAARYFSLLRRESARPGIRQ